MKKMIRRIIPEEDVPDYFALIVTFFSCIGCTCDIFDILLLNRIFSETFFFFPSLMQITLFISSINDIE
jgi:hypothetical protein